MKEGEIWTQQLRSWVRLEREVQYQMGQTWGSGIGNWDGMGLTVGYWCHHRSLALDEVGEEAGAWYIILVIILAMVMVLVIVKGH